MTMLNSVKRKIQSYIWSFFWTNFQLPEISIGQLIDSYAKHEPKINEDICLPPYVGDRNFNDFSILISLIRAFQPKRILELGTAHGNTTANMCVESEANVFTINALPEQMEGNIITFTLSREQIGIVYRNYGFQNRVVQIYENTKNLKISDYLQQRSIDFAFIDACHDADFVVNDFLRVKPTLSDNAIVLFHDTHPSGERHLLDSYLGCMFLRKLGYNIKHIEDSSFGYWTNQEPKVGSTIWNHTRNGFHSVAGQIIYRGQENFIKGIRWLASNFLRGKFNSDAK